VKYEPIVLEEWRVGEFYIHRLVILPSGNLRVVFNLSGAWIRCDDQTCIPKFRRTNARK